jgi:hypothetical protein
MKTKYAVKKHKDVDTLQLQSIGHVVGQPAENIKVGDNLMWNFGGIETVLSIDKSTEKMISITVLYEGKEYKRGLKKSRLVCILQ